MRKAPRVLHFLQLRLIPFRNARNPASRDNGAALDLARTRIGSPADLL